MLLLSARAEEARPVGTVSSCRRSTIAPVTRPADLPDYRDPPIDEVIISLPFVAIPGLTEPVSSLYWLKVRERFPKTQAQPRVEPQMERFNQPGAPFGPFGFQGNFAPPFQVAAPGRFWFVSDDDVSVLQVQNGRFTQNWRRRDEPYPHFEQLMLEYWHHFRLFCELLTEEDLSLPEVQQVELTYINWITDLPMSTFLRVTSPAISMPGMDDTPEDQTITARYVIRNTDPAGDPVARLHVDAQPAVRVGNTEGQVGVQFSLSFRSPIQPGIDPEALDRRFELGREVIVRTFTDLTSDAAHAHWGRYS
jgi:uncharacterized protein (TIGR04255 family)